MLNFGDIQMLRITENITLITTMGAVGIKSQDLIILEMVRGLNIHKRSLIHNTSNPISRYDGELLDSIITNMSMSMSSMSPWRETKADIIPPVICYQKCMIPQGIYLIITI